MSERLNEVPKAITYSAVALVIFMVLWLAMVCWSCSMG